MQLLTSVRYSSREGQPGVQKAVVSGEYAWAAASDQLCDGLCVCLGNWELGPLEPFAVTIEQLMLPFAASAAT